MSESIKMNEDNRTGSELAVIGMAGRFPGARDIHEFWNNLKNGVESVSFYSDEELKERGVSSDVLSNPNFVKSQGGALEDKELFDASFFNYTPKEAEIMDPQMRIFHQCAWEALEDAGYDARSYHGLIGLYAGASPNFYWQGITLLSGKSNELGFMASNQLSDKDYLGTRIAYMLNLKGPAFTMHTACSTSLVAIHLACQGVLNGECNIALAGGVSVSSGNSRGYLYQEGMIFSPDGHCRAFDENARGTIGGEGVGIVVLKALEDALPDKDHIYAVLRGTAVNNDGVRKIGYTAPSIEGQAQVIGLAQHLAEVDPTTTSYVEAHGTGTILGDPVEIEALKMAFNTDKKGFCAIGSVKSNVGHLDAAAGVTSFIKTVLMLMYRLIPPSINFETPNPKIDFQNSPFYVNTQLKEWHNGRHPLRAGVSSFGIGGTNAHVVLEEWPNAQGTQRKSSESSLQYQLILLSAKTGPSLDKMAQRLAKYLQITPNVSLEDVAYTLQVGRRRFQHRQMLVCSTVEEAIQLLSNPKQANVHRMSAKEATRSVVFMFPGLGSQYVDMGQELYQKEPLFRKELDRCFEILNGLVDYDIKEILYPGNSSLEKDAPQGRGVSQPENCNLHLSPEINQIRIVQPLIFIFEYALAQLLITWGIRPDAMIGYSFGEYVAACISGVFTLEDALKLIVLRGQLIEKLPPGVMLSVPLNRETLTSLLNHDLSLAIDNGPSCIVAGTKEAISAFETQMQEKKILCVKLQTSHAIHSKMMEPILEEFAEMVKQIPLNKPLIPYISNVTGGWITDEQAVDPAYWAAHLGETVEFAAGIKELVKEKNSVFVEIGPGWDLSSLVLRYIEKNPGQHVVNMVRHQQRSTSDLLFLMNRIGRLWFLGVEPDWEKMYWAEKPHRVSLPLYPFEEKRFWIDGDPFKMGMEMPSNRLLPGKKGDAADWIYIPSWKKSQLPGKPSGPEPERTCWLVFIDENNWGPLLVKQLEREGQTVITVRAGEKFLQKSDRQFTLNPDQEHDRDYDKLFNELNQQDLIPTEIVHLWSVNKNGETGPDPLRLGKVQDLGYFSLLNIARAIGKQNLSCRIRITVLTNNMHEVTGKDGQYPEKATILGPVKTIPTEYANIRCSSIDVVLPQPGTPEDEQLVMQLRNELISEPPVVIVAYRENQRWVRHFEPMPFESVKKNKTPLKSQGVYLITGGLGGIGLAVAEYLARNFQARLILVGRKGLPDKEQWEQYLNDPQPDNTVKDKIHQVMELEKLGSEILVFSADVSREDQMREVITRTMARFGQINGVIHGAGLPDGEMIQLRSKMASEDIFTAKIQGTLVLHCLLRDIKHDFFILFSSQNSIVPLFGQVAYCAANAFLDAFANSRGTIEPITSVNWDRWQNVGIALIAEQQHKRLTGKTLAGGISREKALEAFGHILGDLRPQMVVSTHHFGSLIEGSPTVNLSALVKEFRQTTVSSPDCQRPDLDVEYVPPQTQVQQKLVEIWANFFGFRQVGIDDDFFELGGDSLKALMVLPKIHKELDIEIPFAEFFNHPTVKSLAEFITTITQKKPYSAIKAVEKKQYFTITSPQRRLSILYQMGLDDVSYNQTNVVRLEGKLDKNRIETTFRKLIQRHESLRTSFHLVNEEPVQKIHTDIKFNMEYYDGSGGEEESNHKLRERIAENFVKPFDLAKAPLLRVTLIKEGEERYLLMMDLHHIIADGLSMVIFFEDFMMLFSGKELPELKIQYKDFAEWKNKQIRHQSLLEQEAYWLGEYKGEIPVLNLPTDYPRPLQHSFEGKRINFELDETGKKALKDLIKQEKSTLFMVLFAIFNILVSKLSGQEDIVIGTPSAGRNQEDLERVMGMFVNTLPIRSHTQGEKTVREFFGQIRTTVVKALENQDYPFEDLVGKVAVSRDVSRNPLFDVMFVLQSMDVSDTKEADLRLKSCQSEQTLGTSKFDLTLFTWEYGGMPSFTLEYCTKLFKEATIKRFIGFFKKIISVVQKDNKRKLSEIEFISEEEKNLILAHFNNTAADYPRDMTIIELFSLQVNKTPHQIAVIGTSHKTDNREEQFLTYWQLNRQANQLARQLRTRGVQSDRVVGLMVERSLEMIIGLFAILKAGGAYLPIATTSPTDRIHYLRTDSSIQLILTQKCFRDIIGDGCDVIAVDDAAVYTGNDRNLKNINQSQDLAYVIYTSGSTGRPKGVMIEHRSVINRLLWMQKSYPLSERDVILQKTPFFFDVSVWELFWWSLVGAAVCMLGSGDEKSPQAIIHALERFNVTTMHFVPSMLNAFLEYMEATGDLKKPVSLRQVFASGEALTVSQVDKFNGLPGLAKSTRLINLYGPTEATVDVSFFNCPPGKNLEIIPIGKPIDNICLYILDSGLNLQPVGIVGELCISGDGLSRGYINNPGLTAEKFIKQVTGAGEKSPPGGRRQKIYKTGDLARWLVDGNIEFLGRRDHQIKIRGYRIELGEIESCLVSHIGVKEAIVMVRENENGNQYLCAYYTAKQELNPTELREYLSGTLPDYMVPTVFVPMEQMPLSPNGKVDRKSLPLVSAAPSQSKKNYVKPETGIEQSIAGLWQEVLKVDQVGIHDSFFELGGTSLDIIKLSARFKEVLGEEVPVITIFRYPTIGAIAEFLRQKDFKKESDSDESVGYLPGINALENEASGSMTQSNRQTNPIKENGQREEEIAVIGVAVRFPGANNISQFWENLKNGVESISFFADEELQGEKIDPQVIKKSNYVRAGGMIEDSEYFDASLFQYTPREAEILDPQIRVFHECAWAALEDAGYHPGTYHGSIGVYAGASPNIYWQGLSLLSAATQSTNTFVLSQLNNKDYLSTLTSYKLNLKGPSVNVQTACSTSLVAIHLACQGLLNGECSMALSGGSSLSLPLKKGYFYQEGMVLSPDGHCRAFDEKANGFVGGSGVGIVVLKRLQDVQQDGDHVYAVVKGTAINNDGIRKLGFTAPSVEGQAETIEAAMRISHISPETVGYVETHGTGTQLGDLVEIEALKLAFATNKKRFCGIGSVKTNIGHLDTAAGVAGFVKSVLILKNKLIPPSLNYETPNPRIDFENSPFYINTELTPWKNNGQPLRAGVSSFGLGGTNAHVILEEAPRETERPALQPVSQPSREYQLILLSAKTKTVLERATQNLVQHLNNNPHINLADAAYTLQVGRKAFPYRRYLVCQDVEGAIQGLSGNNSRKVHSLREKEKNPRVIFLFAGLGSQYVNMGLELYEKETVFRQEMDRCFDIINNLVDDDIKEILYPTAPSPQPAASSIKINQPEIAQIVIFIFEYALAKLLLSRGIRPSALMGYSFGEYLAATLSGIFTLEDALHIIVYRGQLIEKTSPGAMLSVPLTMNEVKPLLDENLSVAIDNGPSCIISGPETAVEDFEKQMKKRRLLGMRLQANHALHARMMQPILKEFEEKLSLIKKETPQIPYVSNVTGNWITQEDARDPVYWARHLSETVRFADGIKLLLQEKPAVLIEIGPGRDLSTLLRHHINQENQDLLVSNLVRHPQENIPDVYYLLNKIGLMWSYGLNLDWQAFYAREKRQRISLPTYPFERISYWIGSDSLKISPEKFAKSSPGKNPDITGWFYIPSWKYSPLPAVVNNKILNKSCWLIFMDEIGLGSQLLKRLEYEGQEIITVMPGGNFSQLTDGQYTIDPGQNNDYNVLLKQLRQIGKVPDKIIHLWSISGSNHQYPRLEYIDNLQTFGFYSLMYLAQAIGKQNYKNRVQIAVISDNIQRVTQEDVISPTKMTVLGAVKVIPLEYHNIDCCSIDTNPSGTGNRQYEDIVPQLLVEFSMEFPDQVVAYRNHDRWVQIIEPVKLKNTAATIPSRLKEKGVYLVTGGLGGIGYTIAQYLAENVRAKLILTGRSSLPPREEWETWIDTYPEDDKVRQKIKKVLTLEESGSEVLVCSADVSNYREMKEVINTAVVRFDQINGVIHAAGLPDGGVIPLRTREMTDEILVPKVKGTLVLDDILRDIKLDFFMICSSLTSITGGLGQLGYCAANSFQDAYAHFKSAGNGRFTVAVNWDTWKEVGFGVESLKQLVENNDIEESEAERLLEYAISTSEGIEAFRRIMEYSFPQVIISTRDMTNGNKLQDVRMAPMKDEDSSLKEHFGKLYPRPELSSEYVIPNTEFEKNCAHILQQHFGFEKVGIHDNLFDFGVTSLDMIHINARLNKELKTDIPLVVMFEFPTIHSLGRYLCQQGIEGSLEEETDDLKKETKLLYDSINLYTDEAQFNTY